MNILVTNDDGIDAPGLLALARVAAGFGRVSIVAPKSPQSATGHSISVLRALPAARHKLAGGFDAWSLDGRPADCVKVALHALLDHRPDWVLSGINCGVNTGTNVFYSGTVSAAVEGAFVGIPSIAFSLELCDLMDYEAAGEMALSLFQQAVERGLAAQTCLSVNIPRLDLGRPRGVRVLRQSRLPMEDRYHSHQDPRGRPVFWLDGLLPHEPSEAATDLSGIHERFVTVTPLKVDLTDEDELRRLGGLPWELGGAAAGGATAAGRAATGNVLHLIVPYRHEEAWVFDDERVGLLREPFVSGIPEMIDRLTAEIPDAARGFKLFFSGHAFPGASGRLDWVRSEAEGHWYRWAEAGQEGWLCPALFRYFDSAPPQIFVRVEARHSRL